MKQAAITIIENDTDLLFLLRQALEGRGYRVCAWVDGRPVFETKKELPDLFIVDKDLPAADGIAICKYLRVHPTTRHLPVIMISAYPPTDKALRAGVTKYLTKPFDLATLVEAIEACLQHEHAAH